MCGIIGIIARDAVATGLLEALRRLEYRGYDSAGIATLVDGRIECRRAEGKLANLALRLDHHDAAVDEADRLLLGAGVGRFDDPLERAVGRQHEAAVGARVGRTHARDEDCRHGAAPLRQQP